MKVIFLINRNFDYFWFSNIFEFLKKRKLRIEFWHLIYNYKSGSKSYLNPNNIKYKNISSIKIIKIKSEKDLIKKINKTKFRKIFSLDPLEDCKLFNNKNFLKNIKKKVVILIRSYDFFLKDNTKYLKFSKYKPILCGISDYKIDISYKYLKKTSQKDFLQEIKKNGIKNIGYFSNSTLPAQKEKNLIIYLPYYSSLDKDYDQRQNYYKYAVAFYEWFSEKNQKITIKHIFKKVFFIFKIFTSYKAINIFLFYNEKKILENLYNFSKYNNLKLVIKTRKKNKIFDYYFENSDKVIIDDHSMQNPNYLQKLLPKSKIVVGYSTEAISETILNNVPFININNLSFTISRTSNNIFFFKTSSKSEYNYKNIIYNFSIYDFVNKFRNLKIQNFFISKHNRRKYLKKFLNFNNDKTLNKILLILKNEKKK